MDLSTLLAIVSAITGLLALGVPVLAYFLTTQRIEANRRLRGVEQLAEQNRKQFPKLRERVGVMEKRQENYIDQFKVLASKLDTIQSALAQRTERVADRLADQHSQDYQELIQALMQIRTDMNDKFMTKQECRYIEDVTKGRAKQG